MPLHWRAWQSVTQRHGIIFSEERFYSLGGVPSRDILKVLCQEQGLTLDPIRVPKEKEAAYLEFLAHVDPIEVVVSIAREYYGKIPLAVASSGSHAVI